MLENSKNCRNKPCVVRIVGNQIFKDQGGGLHAILVTAAEPVAANASHASGAVIGMAWLSHSGKGWMLDLGSPSVSNGGAFGKAPEVYIIEGGVWGKAVVIQQGDMHQGIGERNWQLFVPDRTRGTFVLGLNLLTARESSGACPVDPPTVSCFKDDFTTKLNLLTEQDGLTVVATLSYPPTLHRSDEVKSYHVTRSGLAARRPTHAAVLQTASSVQASGVPAKTGIADAQSQQQQKTSVGSPKVYERAGDIFYSDGRGVERQITDRHIDTEPALSPDGKTIAFIRIEGKGPVPGDVETGDDRALWIADGYSGTLKRLLGPNANARPAGRPTFSLDGDLIYFWPTIGPLRQQFIR